MATDVRNTEDTSVASLVKGILDDATDLFKQQIAMAKVEVKQEIDKSKQALISLAIGAGLAFIGGLLLCFALAFALDALIEGMPTWGAFLIVGGLFAAVGGFLLYTGKNKAAEINVVPEQTIETAKENVQWIQSHT